ncbi:MAG TPA: 50S ribosomal protein L29 [Dissulfurispiraceae bacterium]|jgi:large subunit ribosomal protein L29|nr:50S ribosomal protein L29 [Dissulfurispiraceae bacterium]
MKPAELRGLSVEELRQKELDLKKELFNLRFRLSKGELENNMRIRAVRKDIARVLTVITEKQGASQPHKRSDRNA